MSLIMFICGLVTGICIGVIIAILLLDNLGIEK